MLDRRKVWSPRTPKTWEFEDEEGTDKSDDEHPEEVHRPAFNYSGAASAERVFISRMKCIACMKSRIEDGRYRWNEAARFSGQLSELMELWHDLTFEDVNFASRSAGKHLGRLFEMLTLRVPKVYVDVALRLGDHDQKVAFRMARRLPEDSLFHYRLDCEKTFYVYRHTDVGDGTDIEGMWRRHVPDALAATAESYNNWPTQVDVHLVGVDLMHQDENADLLLMMLLALFEPARPHATAADALLHMCWVKQRPIYLTNIFYACVSILALGDITRCTKLLKCGAAHPGEACCVEPELQLHRRLSTLLVLFVGLWFLIADGIQAFILIRETRYLKHALQSTSTFEFLLEATTTVIAAKILWDGWVFATNHYVQFFLVVACRWLHLLYLLLPLPSLAKTVLPMYKAALSYESKAFILVNLVTLAGAFQAYISLRSDINTKEMSDVMQPMGDALMSEYMLNFLGYISIGTEMGDSQQLTANRTLTTKIGGCFTQRQGIAVYVVFITFVQVVLLLNLYVGVLGESYYELKKKRDTECMRFRAHFMLKNLCLMRFFDKYVRLKCLSKCLAEMNGLARARSLWVICPHGDTKNSNISEDATPDSAARRLVHDGLTRRPGFVEEASFGISADARLPELMQELKEKLSPMQE